MEAAYQLRHSPDLDGLRRDLEFEASVHELVDIHVPGAIGVDQDEQIQYLLQAKSMGLEVGRRAGILSRPIQCPLRRVHHHVQQHEAFAEGITLPERLHMPLDIATRTAHENDDEVID